MQDLHGCADRVRDPRVWPHDHVYGLRQGPERVSHLSAVHRAGGSILPGVTGGGSRPTGIVQVETVALWW